MGNIKRELRHFSTLKGGPLAFEYLVNVITDQANLKSNIRETILGHANLTSTLDFGALSPDSERLWTPTRRVSFITERPPGSYEDVEPLRTILVTTGLNLPKNLESIYAFNWDPRFPEEPAVTFSQKIRGEKTFEPAGYRDFAKAFAEVIQHANGGNYRVSFRQ